ncbi:YncE family protein [Aureivirga marina]|uniref:YncE family protein n=1 Tax=Aureivirga marina TaxID=1182451 RepID=UPI0018CA28F1|nr:hypothetical protein [Aureivirga marina]
MKLTKLFLALAVSSSILVSCGKDTEDRYLRGNYDEGLLITNKGQETGSVSFVSYNFSNTENNIFKKVNGQTLGKNVSSLGFYIEEAAIVVSDENKVVSVDRYRFTEIAETSQHLNQPRYFISNQKGGQDGKGYITNWGETDNPDDDFIAIMHMNTHTIISKIPVGMKPEKMLLTNNRIYITHAGEMNNKISVFDVNSEEIIREIEVGYNVNSLQVDDDGKIWVLCSGKQDMEETAGQLFKINQSSFEIETSFYFGNNSNHPTNLNYYKRNFYYVLNGDVYQMHVNSPILSQIPLITGQNIESISVGKEKIFGINTNSGLEEGIVKIFNLTTLTKEKEFTLEMNPENVYYNAYSGI